MFSALGIAQTSTIRGQSQLSLQAKGPATAQGVVAELQTQVGPAASTVNIDKLIGIPFLRPGPPESRDEIVARLQKSILNLLPQLSGYPKDFAGLKQHKAVAIQYRGMVVNPFVPYLYQQEYIYPFVGYWGGKWDSESLEAARETALRNCATGGAVSVTFDTFGTGKIDQDKSKSCSLLLEEDTVLVSDEMISDYIKTRDTFIGKQVSKLKRADILVLLDRAMALTASANLPSSDQFSPPLTNPLEVGYPDEQQDYASACQDRVFYALMPLDNQEVAQISSRLSRVNQTGIYGAYDRRVDTVKDFTTQHNGNLMEHMARFTRHYDFTTDPAAAKTLRLPQNLEDLLVGQVIREIWLEGSVRITHANLPLIFDRYLSPVAVRTDQGFFLGVQLKMPDEGFAECYVSKPFSGKVLQLTGPVSTPAYAQKALDALLASIKSFLAAEPIAADFILNEIFAPGEFGMSREHKPSHLLGAPYYESSTYTVETWAAEEDDPFGSLYGRSSFKGARSEHLRRADQIIFFMKVSHVHTRAVQKNDKYSDPSTTEIVTIDDAVNKGTTKALSNLCARLKGSFDGTICKINQPF